MQKLNFYGILHDITKDLRAIQDIDSEPIDIDEVSNSDYGGTEKPLGEDGVKPRQAANDG